MTERARLHVHRTRTYFVTPARRRNIGLRRQAVRSYRIPPRPLLGSWYEGTVSGIPEEQLAKLRGLHGSTDEGTRPSRTLRLSDVWLLPAGMTAFVIEAKDRPHLIVGLQGPDDAPTRALLIE